MRVSVFSARKNWAWQQTRLASSMKAMSLVWRDRRRAGRRTNMVSACHISLAWALAKARRRGWSDWSRA